MPDVYVRERARCVCVCVRVCKRGVRAYVFMNDNVLNADTARGERLRVLNCLTRINNRKKKKQSVVGLIN